MRRFLCALLAVAMLWTAAPGYALRLSDLFGFLSSEPEPQEMLTVLEELEIEGGEWALAEIEKYNEAMQAYDEEAGAGFLMDMAVTYETLLAALGTGTLDEETLEFVPVTDSVYAFDIEMWDILGFYGEFLDNVARISGGEIAVSDYHSEIDEEAFLAGEDIDVQPVEFVMNGREYRFEADFQGDWMDCTIIDFINEILEESGGEKRLWCMYDDGQGMIVFYRTEAWAQEFWEKTGCELSMSVWY